jgi:hypothetical protein
VQKLRAENKIEKLYTPPAPEKKDEPAKKDEPTKKDEPAKQ